MSCVVPLKTVPQAVKSAAALMLIIAFFILIPFFSLQQKMTTKKGGRGIHKHTVSALPYLAKPYSEVPRPLKMV